MMLGVIFLGVPLALIAGLALMPPGRWGTIALIATGLFIAWLIASYAFTLRPLFIGDSHADAYTEIMVWIYAGAWGLGAMIHLVRRFAPGMLALAVGGALLLIVAAIYLLGI